MTAGTYVIDSNVLFGAFISGKDVYHLLFSEHTVYLPDFAFVEIEKYKQRILKKTRLAEEDLQEFILRLLRNITVIPALVLAPGSLEQAYQLCREIDEKDISASSPSKNATSRSRRPYPVDATSRVGPDAVC